MNKLDLVILIGTALAFIIAFGYILLALRSNKLLNTIQQSKLIELEKSEHRLRSLFEHSLAGMFKFNLRTFEVVDANSTFRILLNWRSECDYKYFKYSIPEKDLNFVQSEILQNGNIEDYEIFFTSLNGKKFWGLLAAEMIGEEDLAHGVLIDISRKKAFEEINEEQASLLNETQDAIIVLDETGHITFWNSSAELLYGYPIEASVGTTLKEKVFSNGNSNEFEQAWTDVMEFNEWIGTQNHTTLGGQNILVESHWKKISSKATGRKIILIINTDITEKKRNKEMYLRAQKMETLALLTSGIAHDLQNIFSPVSLSIELLKTDLKEKKSLQILSAVEESTTSGMQLLKKILSIGKGIQGENESVDMNTFLDGIIESFSIGLPDSIQIEKIYKMNQFTVMGDHNQLQQVFLNLLINARDAIPVSGKISISMHSIKKDELYSQELTLKQFSEYGVFSIGDTGPGIKESDFDKIFDPFYTTKSPDKGTGLGLSIVQNIVKNHDGFVEVESSEGKGANFKVYLPIVSNPLY